MDNITKVRGNIPSGSRGNISSMPSIRDGGLKRVLGLSLGHFAVDFYMMLIPSIVPFLVLTLKLTQGQVGLIITAINLLSSSLQPVLGLVLDKRGNRKMVVYSLLWISIMMSAIAFTDSFILIVVIATAASLGSTLYHPLGAVIVNEHSGRKRGLYTSVYAISGNLAAAVTPLVIVPMVNRFGALGIAYSVGIGIAAAVVMIYTRSAGAGDQAEYHGQPEGTRPAATCVDCKKNMVFLTLAEILRTWAFMVLTSFLSLYYVNMGYSEIAASRIFTLFNTLAVLGLVLSGFMLSRHSSRKLLILTGILSVVAYALFMMTSGAASIVFIVAAGVCMRFSFTIAMVKGQELMPQSTGMVSGLMMGLTFGVGSVGAYITGIIADRIGLYNALYTQIPVLVAATLLTLFFKPPKDIDLPNHI
ncbi:MAG: MFS transporter [Mahellales bacterium]